MVGVQGSTLGAEIVARAGERVVAPEDGFLLYTWQDLSVLPVKLIGANFEDDEGTMTPEQTDPVPRPEVIETDIPNRGGIIMVGASGMRHVIAGLASTEWGPVMSRHVTQAAQRFSIPMQPIYRTEQGLLHQKQGDLMPIAPIKMGEPIGRVDTGEVLLWRVQSDEFEPGTGVDPVEWLEEMRAKGAETSVPSGGGGPGALVIAAAVLWFSSRKKRR